MRMPSRQAVVVLGVASLMGIATACTKITGLDRDYSELPCFPGACDLDASGASMDAASTDDRTSTPPPPHSDGSVPVDDGGLNAPDGPSADGAPTSTCSPGTIECAAGCVAPDDIHYCGSCTNDCTKLPNVDLGGAVSAVVCNAGRCTYACAAGYADCDDAGEGCATSLGASVSCGACGSKCTSAAPLCAPTVTTADASTYSCSLNCPASAPTVCAGSCVDEQTSSTSCGGCGAAFACAAGTTCISGHCLGPKLSLAPAQYAFAATTLGARSTGMSFVVTNSGNGTSGSLTVAMAGANATEFLITSDGCTGQTLAPNTSCTISVVFAPASRGARAASLNVNGGQLFSALTGTGQDSVLLTVTKTGTGGGTVAGGPISCGSTCSGAVTRASPVDPVVTLTATADASSTFGGWSGGGCTGTGTTCNVTMSQAETVSARFDKKTVALTVTARAFGTASGTITSSPAGVNCAAPCSQVLNVPPGTQVTVSTAGGANVWWGSSACTGTTCATTVSAAATLTVTFSNNNYVFPTSNTYTGNLGGLTGADALCAQAATGSGLPGQYVAWLATSATTALARLGGARGWIGTTGLPFADTIGASGGTTGIRNGQIYDAAQYNEFGKTNPVGFAGAWTGANEDGTLVGPNCDDWSNNTSSVNGAAGVQTYGSGEWTFEFEDACTGTYSIYCFGVNSSTPVTVPGPTGRIAFLSNGKFTPGGGISAADSLCQSEAATDGFAAASTFLAFLPTTTASAVSRFNTSGAPWQRPDGIALAPTAAAIVGTLSAAPTQRGDGTYFASGNDSAWSGAMAPDQVGTSTSTCNNWSTNSAASTGQTGSFASPTNWFFSSGDPCSDPLAVYCFQP